MQEEKKYILGINLPLKSKCHESGIALINNEGKIIFAINEERLSRKKLDGDFPELSIKKMLEYKEIKIYLFFLHITNELSIFPTIPFVKYKPDHHHQENQEAIEFDIVYIFGQRWPKPRC